MKKDTNLYIECYRFEQQYNWLKVDELKESIRPIEFMKEHNLTSDDIYNYACSFLERTMKKEEVEQYINKKKKRVELVVFMTENAACERLLDSKNYSEGIYIIDRGQITQDSIDNYILSIKDSENAEEIGLRLIEMYYSYINRRKAIKEAKDKDQKETREEEAGYLVRDKKECLTILIKLLLRSNCNSFVQFADLSKLNIKTIKKAFSFLEEVDKEKYNFVINELNRRFIEKNSKLFEDMPFIVESIKSSMNTDGNEVKPFDIIDYYEQYGYPLYDLKRANKMLSQKDFSYENKKIIYKFISKNNYPNIKKESVVKKLVFKIDYSYKDVTLTTEEKVKIYKYIKERKIPFNSYIYTMFIKHYFDGKIDLSKTRKLS